MLPPAARFAGRILGSVQLESDPGRFSSLGRDFNAQRLRSYITDQTASFWASSSPGGIDLPATVEWNDYFPDLFSGWYRQASNIPFASRPRRLRRSLKQ